MLLRSSLHFQGNLQVPVVSIETEALRVKFAFEVFYEHGLSEPWDDFESSVFIPDPKLHLLFELVFGLVVAVERLLEHAT